MNEANRLKPVYITKSVYQVTGLTVQKHSVVFFHEERWKCVVKQFPPQINTSHKLYDFYLFIELERLVETVTHVAEKKPIINELMVEYILQIKNDI